MISRTIPENNPDSRLIDVSNEYRAAPIESTLYVQIDKRNWEPRYSDSDRKALIDIAESELRQGKILGWVIKNHRGEIVETHHSVRVGVLLPGWVSTD